MFGCTRRFDKKATREQPDKVRNHPRKYVPRSFHLVQIEQAIEHLPLKLKGQDMGKKDRKRENGFNTPA